MIALFSRWTLRNGCPPEFKAALDELTEAVERQEPGTLIFSVNVPAPHPPIGPPPEYAVAGDITSIPLSEQKEIVFFEVYRDAEAFSAHLNGPFSEFLTHNRHFFHTPWQGHPVPVTIYLEPQSWFVRSALAGSKVGGY